METEPKPMTLSEEREYRKTLLLAFFCQFPKGDAHIMRHDDGDVYAVTFTLAGLPIVVLADPRFREAAPRFMLTIELPRCVDGSYPYHTDRPSIYVSANRDAESIMADAMRRLVPAARPWFDNITRRVEAHAEGLRRRSRLVEELRAIAKARKMTFEICEPRRMSDYLDVWIGGEHLIADSNGFTFQRLTVTDPELVAAVAVNADTARDARLGRLKEAS